jgi:hypothetical protein
MDKFENDFGQFWAGIAVHGGSSTEPMRVPVYDEGILTMVSGHPSSVVDRGTDVDPSAMTTDFYTRLQVAPTAFITNGATWDAGTRTLNVSISSEFQASANNNYKIACVLTEDGVTGTGSLYNQANSYAGGGNGVMGGYELLPNPVPASQMVYDHVARQIAPSFGGFAGSFPATVSAGETHTVNFSFVLPAGWEDNEMHIIGMLISPDGRIDNAGKTTITEAVANGYVSGLSAGLFEENVEQVDAMFKLYPNPAADVAVVAIQLNSDSDVSMKLIDMSGKELASRNYGTMSGISEIIVNTSGLNPGVYLVEVTVNGSKMTNRLVVE